MLFLFRFFMSAIWRMHVPGCPRTAPHAQHLRWGVFVQSSCTMSVEVFKKLHVSMIVDVEIVVTLARFFYILHHIHVMTPHRTRDT